MDELSFDRAPAIICNVHITGWASSGRSRLTDDHPGKQEALAGMFE